MNQTFVSNSIQTHSLSLKIVSALEVFLRLKPRKYKYNEYIITIVDVLFLTNPNNIHVRIDIHS